MQELLTQEQLTQEQRSILVVDDEPDLRSLIRGVVSRMANFTVEEAGDGNEALQIVKNNPHFDAIFTDFRMPEKDGLEFCSSLHAEGLYIPVVIVTSHLDFDIIRTALRLGTVDFLPKPFSNSDLVASVCRAAEIGASMRQFHNTLDTSEHSELRDQFQKLSILKHLLM